MGQNCCAYRSSNLNPNIVDGKTYMIAPAPEQEESFVVVNNRKELSFNNGYKKDKKSLDRSVEEVTS